MTSHVFLDEVGGLSICETAGNAARLGGDRLMKRISFVLGGVALLSSAALAEKDDSKTPARSPAGILVYSKDGSDSMQGLCHDEGRFTVCDVTEIRIIPPDMKRIDEEERKLLEAAKKDPRTKDELTHGGADMRETMEKLRADPDFGPKARRIWEEMTAALEAKDLARWAHASMEQDRHTCHIMTSQSYLRFHRVGPRKWITDAEPEGLCRIVNVWEMTADDKDGALLTIVVSTVSIGNPGGLLCPSSIKDVEDRTPLSTMSGKKQYEPQPSCDFISPTL